MARRLFCEIHPLTLRISVAKERALRRLRDLLHRRRFALIKAEPLPVIVYRHNSLIRRTLGNVDMRLQENKAVNLAIAAPKVTGVIIRPGETFSFWRLVGPTSARKGYKEGLTLSSGQAKAGIGGGLCQFTNLLHWMALHSPLDIIEHHHHDGADLFPDYGRTVPFGCGTSICYNYLDYCVTNNTGADFQFIVYVTDTYLCGELRSSQPQSNSYHVVEEDACFVREGAELFRENRLYVQIIDKATGRLLEKRKFKESHARVLYDHSFVAPELIKEKTPC